jgi:putative glycosyltransferase (TIGR04372 family)
MKILISIGLWGRSYTELFVDYALASQLSSENIPHLSTAHDVTYHIVTTRKDHAWLREQPAIKELDRHCTIDWDLLENRGFDPLLFPTGPEGIKYTFLSIIQNIAIKKSLDYDAIVFNYADFIWADGSLTRSIEMLEPGIDAVLSFCLPVDRDKGIAELDAVRTETDTPEFILDLHPRRGAGLAIDCMHRETKLRYWEEPPFTVTPTYILWKVKDEGVLIRAYHQTILAMRVRPEDPDYREGIQFGSLDGHYTSILADRDRNYHATVSDDVLVFSLYDTIVESHIGGPSRHRWDGFDRDASLRECLGNVITPGQRNFALIPLEVRRSYDDHDAWADVEAKSRRTLEFFHDNSPFEADEYDQMHKAEFTVDESAHIWRWTIKRRLARMLLFVRQRVLKPMRDSAYRWVLRALSGPVGNAIQNLIGRERARSLREAGEKLIYGHTRDKEPDTSVPLPDLALIVSIPDAELGSKYLIAGHAKELIETVSRFMAPAAFVPNVQLTARDQACLHSGLYSEHVINNIADPVRLNRLLKGAEIAFREAIKSVPVWSEAHRALGRNLWFQGKFDAAIEAFETAENCLPQIAGTAEWQAEKYAALPRNCAHVIGLMGHIDAFIKYRIMSGDTRRYYLLAPESEIVNPVFLDYWRPHLLIEDPANSPELARQEPAYSVNWNWIMPGGDDSMVHIHRGIARVQRRWAETKDGESLLQLSPEHAALLETQKKAWGMGAKDKFVCVHVRSDGFYADKKGTAQHFRNTPIDDYYPMIRALTDAGYWVFRMGEPSVPPLDLSAIGGDTDKVIDYAHRPERSHELDVALCATCELFVSSPSGLHTVAHAFGRPACYVNFPIYAGFPWHPNEIIAPQRYYSRAQERVLSLEEVLSSDLVHADHQFLLDMREVELLHNSPEDIRETVLEALAPDTYSLPDDARSHEVCNAFDRLNQEHSVDISGRLGRYYAANYADELCPASPATAKKNR